MLALQSAEALEGKVATSLRRLHGLRAREQENADRLAMSMRGVVWARRPRQQRAVAAPVRTWPTSRVRGKRGWVSARSGQMHARMFRPGGGGGGGGVQQARPHTAATPGRGPASESLAGDLLRSFTHPSNTTKRGWVARDTVAAVGSSVDGEGAFAAEDPELPDADSFLGKEALHVCVDRSASGFWKSGNGFRPQLPPQCMHKRAKPVRAAPFEMPRPALIPRLPTRGGDSGGGDVGSRGGSARGASRGGMVSTN